MKSTCLERLSGPFPRNSLRDSLILFRAGLREKVRFIQAPRHTGDAVR